MLGNGFRYTGAKRGHDLLMRQSKSCLGLSYTLTYCGGDIQFPLYVNAKRQIDVMGFAVAGFFRELVEQVVHLLVDPRGDSC